MGERKLLRYLYAAASDVISKKTITNHSRTKSMNRESRRTVDGDKWH